MPIKIVREDITRIQADAIVNAANHTLLGGGGVDGAIHEAAGPELLEECRKLGGCETGGAKITRGYNLPAKYVIHTVGPVYEDGAHHEKELLTACYRNSLELAASYGCESVALPMIATGAYGYPRREALDVALNTAVDFLNDHEMLIYLVVFDREMYRISDRIFYGVKAYIDDTYADDFFAAELRTTYMPPAGRRRPRPEDIRKEGALPGSRRPVQKKPRRRADESFDFAPCMASQDETAACGDLSSASSADVSIDELTGYLRNTDVGFSEALLALIDMRGMTDAECYKKANIDRKLFNHIKNDKKYRPSKKTVLAFTVALRLTPEEAERLLNRAGYSLSDSEKLDRAIRFFLIKKVYDINRINIMLFDLDLPTLGA